MKAKRIFSFFFSFILIAALAQKKQDSLVVKWKYTPNFSVGIDVLNAGLAVFSDRKLIQGSVSTNIIGKWYAVADLGFEKNIYKKNGYDALVNGPFLKVGALYMLANDREDVRNGFLAGGKLAGSFYNQEYFAIPVRGFGNNEMSQSFPRSKQSSYWIEASVGGRVHLFESPFSIEVTMQPKYLIYTTTQDGIQPMIVPGFGKSASKFKIGFSWNVAYSF